MSIVHRMTKQKRIILEILQSTKTHPTADWVYEQARKQIPDISLGTVYRNLNNLKAMGKIMELSYGSSFSRYDGNSENHYHFHCVECGRVLDLDMPVNRDLEKQVEELEGHKVQTHRLEFYGVCRDCVQKKLEQDRIFKE